MDATDRGSRPPPSTPRSPWAGGARSEVASLDAPSSDRTDPDGALYAAVRARPDWIEKPAAQAALQQLGAGLATGEDPLYWQVTTPGEVKISGAKEHAPVLVLGEAASTPDVRRTGLESGRVYVERSVEPRVALPVRACARSRGWLALPFACMSVLGVALGSVRIVTVWPPPASSVSLRDTPATAPTGSEGAAPAATAAFSVAPVPMAPARGLTGPAAPASSPARGGAKPASRLIVAASSKLAASSAAVDGALGAAPPSVPAAPAVTVPPAVRTGPRAPETQPDF